MSWFTILTYVVLIGIIAVLLLYTKYGAVEIVGGSIVGVKGTAEVIKGTAEAIAGTKEK